MCRNSERSTDSILHAQTLPSKMLTFLLYSQLRAPPERSPLQRGGKMPWAFFTAIFSPEPGQLTGCEITQHDWGLFLIEPLWRAHNCVFPSRAGLLLILVLAWPSHRGGLWEQASPADLPMPLGNFTDCYINAEHHIHPQSQHWVGFILAKSSSLKSFK